MKFITLSGIDGSGKSTQLSLLRDHFEQQGKVVVYFHAIEFSTADRLKRFFTGEKHFIPGAHTAVTHASWLSLLARKFLLFIDLLRFRSYLSCLRQNGGDYLLSDRYFYDTLVNLAYLAGRSTGVSFFEPLIPKPDHALYLDLSPDSVMTRERAPEQGLAYLKMKASLFQENIPRWKMIKIDAHGPKEEVYASILKTLS